MNFDFDKLNRPASGYEALENRVSYKLIEKNNTMDKTVIDEQVEKLKKIKRSIIEKEYSKMNACLDNNKETIKFDQGKPDFTLIPQEALLEVAKVFSKGADKYGVFNYSHGTNYRRYIAASMRHLNQWLRGEDIDEIGTNHLSNAIASIMMVLDNQLTNTGIDDRNKIYKKIKND